MPNLQRGNLRKMEGMGYIQWPCTDEGPEDQGTQYLYKAKSSTVRTAKLSSLLCDWEPPMEDLSEEFPLILSPQYVKLGHSLLPFYDR